MGASSMSAYNTTQERKYTEEQRRNAYLDYCERQKTLSDTSSAEERKKCSISEVAREHNIGRSSLSLYIKAQKLKEKETNEQSDSREEVGSSPDDSQSS
jgi:transposase-like protein